MLAIVLLNLTADEFDKLVDQGKYLEVQTNDKNKEL